MSGGTVALGGDTKEDERYISPTVLVDVDLNSPLMTEEIFGPLLPIVSVKSVDDAISFVTARPHPLALYVFAENKSVIDNVLARTTAGGVTVNGTLMHLTSPHLPSAKRSACRRATLATRSMYLNKPARASSAAELRPSTLSMAH
ncbi:MAG: aldehyde dehydrogenase family protein [Actinobacteria bacterium]|nr:aldehyde dehydrogenase family protein [Actinomycetota bacterium]